MAIRGIARQAKAGAAPIKSNENALRSNCKRCHRTIYAWQETVWLTGRIIGLVHAKEDDCDLPALPRG